MSLLKLEGVVKNRDEGSGYSLKIPHFSINPGEHVAITGQSGCGKSTTLDMLGMILEPDEAEVFSLNTGDKTRDVAALWRAGKVDALTELRRANLGYVLQTGGLFSFLTARENIELAALTSGKSQAQAKRLAQELVEKLDIAARADARPESLSIGQRQRVAIARAIASTPKLLLADEPTAALDPENSENVMRLFLDTVKDYGASVILVTHDLGLAHRFGFREAKIQKQAESHGTWVLHDGQ